MVVWLVVLTIGGSRRRKMICPRRVSNGGEEEVVEGVLRSVRWSFAVTHDGHVEIILPRRWRDFFGNMDGLVVIVVAAAVVAVDEEEEDVLLLFNVVIAVGWWWWWWIRFLPGRWDCERLVLELFRRVHSLFFFFVDFRFPQHRNGNVRVRMDVTVAGWEDFFSIESTIEGPVTNSDDDDDRVIEMTGGGDWFRTLVFDFVMNKLMNCLRRFS